MRERINTDNKEDVSKENVKQEEDECPECGGSNFQEDTKRGEIVCSDCGCVCDEDVIDHGPEWRSFNNDEEQEKSRVGPPLREDRHDKGLTTSINWQDQDANGNNISQSKKSTMRRLRKRNKRSKAKDSEEKNLREAFSEINRMSSALRIPDKTKTVACTIYRRVLNEDLVRGRSIEGVATSCIYIACRQGGIPRSMDEVERVSRVDKKEISSTYRYIQEELSIEVDPAKPSSFVPRFCSQLDLSKSVENRAVEISEEAEEDGLHSGKSPTGFAAASIYAAGLLENEKKTQEEIAEVADVTEVTIRNRYQEQVKHVTDM